MKKNRNMSSIRTIAAGILLVNGAMSHYLPNSHGHNAQHIDFYSASASEKNKFSDHYGNRNHDKMIDDAYN